MMISKNKRLALFKAECRRYFYYQSEIAKIDDSLRNLAVKMCNVHSPSTQKIGSSPSRHELDYIRLIETKTEFEKKKAYYQARLDWINDIIDSIPSRAYSAITWMTLVQAKTKMDIIITYDAKPEYVYKIRDQFLIKELTDERMDAYHGIEEKYPEYLLPDDEDEEENAEKDDSDQSEG